MGAVRRAVSTTIAVSVSSAVMLDLRSTRASSASAAMRMTAAQINAAARLDLDVLVSKLRVASELTIAGLEMSAAMSTARLPVWQPNPVPARAISIVVPAGRARRAASALDVVVINAAATTKPATTVA
jgi:hypothetical protein